MKPLSLSVAMCIALSVMPASTLANNGVEAPLFSQTIAISGCCKVRQSTTSPWVQNGMTYEQCESSNAAEGDSIFQSSGVYWWDRAC